MTDEAKGVVKVALTYVITVVLTVCSCMAIYYGDRQAMAENIRGNTERIQSMKTRLERIDNKLDRILFEVKK